MIAINSDGSWMITQIHEGRTFIAEGSDLSRAMVSLFVLIDEWERKNATRRKH